VRLGLHACQCVLECRKILKQIARLGAGNEPSMKRVGICGGEPRGVPDLFTDLEDRRNSEPSVEVIVQQRLRCFDYRPEFDVAGHCRQWTILEIGNSRMSVAPASLSAGITVLTSRFSTTDSTAQSPDASFDTVGDLAAGSTFSTAA